MYWALLEHVGRPGGLAAIATHLRICVSGGAAMPVEMMRKFEVRVGAKILEGYGLSETSPVVCFNHLHQPTKPGTVGLPIFGVDVHCVDDEGRPSPSVAGEIVIRGPNVMKSYYNRPEATDDAMRHGWFHTGDIGVLDADADRLLWIRNNSDKMINQDSGDWTIKSRNFERTFRVNLPEIQPRETKSVVWGVDGFKVSINEALQVEPRDVSLSNVVACLQPQSRHSKRLSFTVWNRDKNQTQRVDRSRWSVKTAAFSVSVVLDRIELEPGAVATVEGDATGMEWAKCLDFKPDKNQESPLELICYNIKSENEVSLLLRKPN